MLVEPNQRRSVCSSSAGLVAAVLVLLSATAVTAQDRFDLVTFRPAPSQEAGALETMGGSLLGRGELDLGVITDFARSPFTIETDTGLTEGKIVTSLTTFHLLAAAGLYERVEIGVDMPIVAAQAGDSIPGFRTQPLAESTTAPGDLRLVPRALLWDRDGAIAMGLTLAVDLGLPTGDRDTYAGDGAVRVEPTVGFGVRLPGGHRVLADAGYRIRRQVEYGPVAIDDALVLRAAGEVRVATAVRLVAEVATATVFQADLGGEDAPVEMRGGVRADAGPVRLTAFAGTGLTTGAGAADWRAGAGVGWSGGVGGGEREPRVATSRQRTADLPPDGDLDGDGIPNSRDACPNQPEDYDAWDDTDGCPDLDRDGDGIIDYADQCVTVPETFNGVEDDDGCPETYAVYDRDNDLVPDELDECPDETEDLDGLADTDGCPEIDADGDGVPDTDDACPLVAGVDGGCPDEEPFVGQRTVRIEFLPDSFTPDRAAREQIREAAAMVAGRGRPYRIRVTTWLDESLDRAVARTMAERRLEEIVELLVASGVRVDSVDVEAIDERRPGSAADIELDLR